MGGEWRQSPLSDLIKESSTITYGVVKPGPEGEITFVRGGDINNGRIITENLRTITKEISQSYKRTILEGGELLVSLVGNPGQVALVPHFLKGANIARQVGLIRLDSKKILPEWVKYFLLSPAGQESLGSHSIGSVQQVINLRDLKTVKIPRPPFSEQRAIAHILGTLDDKIELNRRMNKTLEAMAQALFKSWFVDFDPVVVNAIRAGNPIPEKFAQRAAHYRDSPAALGLPEDTLRLFPNRFHDSELGPIPEGWEVGRLGDIAEHPRRSISPNEIPFATAYIGLEHMPRKSIALSEWSTSDEVASNKFQFQRGEILFGKLRPYFHKVGIAPLNGICSTDVVVIKPKHSEWFGMVLGYVSSQAFVDYANACSTGTRMPRTNWKNMALYEVIMPPLDLAGRFNGLFLLWVQEIISNIHESKTLAKLRDTLLPKLISGELRVPDAEKLLEDAL